MKVFKKLFALLLTLAICLGCFSNGTVFAAKTTINTASTSNAFAKATAEIIKNDETDSMLRIIGKFSKRPSDYVFSQATDAVVSRDGRFVLQFSSEKKLLSCLENLNKNPDIIYAERDMPIYTEALDAAEEYLSWGTQAIEADVYSQKIASNVSGRSITVAIVDSGCEDIDFIKDKLVPGYDFFENDSDAYEDISPKSHGTFLASVIVDCTRNLPVKIMPIRILDLEEASLINAINGIRYAADNGADVINISLGAVLSKCNALEDAINYATEKNISVVVCAGNLKIDIKNFCPAHIEDVITVSSVNQNNEFSEIFSNYGDNIDLAAPGENIVGYNASGELTALYGTSVSAAFVSAAAAMYRLDNQGCTAKQVQDSLNEYAEDFGDEGWDNKYGWGVIRLGNIPVSNPIPVESISFPMASYSLTVGETLEINPIFAPDAATDKSFTLSADNGNVTIKGNVITAVSAGTTTLVITSSNGKQGTATVTISEKIPEITATIKIKNNSGSKTINYGETLRLTAETTNQPNGTAVWWYVDGIKSGEGNTFEISPESGSVEVSAKLVDENGTVLIDKNGNEISDFETVTVNSGFFQKLISFFKNLFKINRTVIQVFTKR